MDLGTRPEKIAENEPIARLYHEQASTCDKLYQKIAPYRKIALSVAETLEKKNHDYGDSFTKLYREFGDLSAVIRLTDKLERYKSLITSEQKVNDESIEDTLMDLAGYAILTIIARKGASS